MLPADQPLALGVAPLGASHEGFKGVSKGFPELLGAADYGNDELGQDCREPLCRLQSRHSHLAHQLCGLGDEPLEQRGGDACPEEPFDDLFVRCRESVEVRVGFPLFENQLNLPIRKMI